MDLQLKKLNQDYFHFNSPYGACEECEGIGIKLNVDPNLVVPDQNKSLADGAIEPWGKIKFTLLCSDIIISRKTL